MSIRAAFVGTGSWARRSLIPAFAAQPTVAVAAIIDPDGEAAAQAKELTPRAAICRDLDEALERHGPIGLVVIATPDHLHPPLIEAALAVGAAVFCEKPLANDAAAAGELARLAIGRAATVGYSFRFNPAIQMLKCDLAAGRIGIPWLIELSEHNPQFHPHARKSLNWKSDPSSARAGALYEYGSHVVDLALWLIGPVQRVSSALARVLPSARLDDIATLQLEFAQPTIGTLVASWLLRGGFPGIGIRIHGSEAIAEVALDHRIPGGQSYRIGSPISDEIEAQKVEPMQDPRNDATRRHAADFLAVITQGTSRYPGTLPTLTDGARAQAVLEASLHATDRWATVEFAELRNP
jgi:1,5-anhydro-D-fructose reductase (1,5-anhydro-D-mannitol-forming)